MVELAQRPKSDPQQTRSALVAMASRLNVEPTNLMNTLKSTVFKGANNEELLALTVVANQYGLNPFLKQLYAFPAKGGGIVPMVSIDGWSSIVNQCPDYDGVEFEYEDTPDGKPLAVTCTMHHKRRSHPVRVTEFWSECQRNTEPWRQSPRRMLRHKAFIQCARVAFSLGGIYDEDEAQPLIDVPASDVNGETTPAPKARQLAAKIAISKPAQVVGPADEQPQGEEEYHGERAEDQQAAQPSPIPANVNPETGEEKPPTITDYASFIIAVEGEAAASGVGESDMNKWVNGKILVKGAKGKESTLPADLLHRWYAEFQRFAQGPK